MPATGPIGYNLNIPNAPNNPSADQPLMQVNTNATDQLLNIDHYSFSSNQAGQHKQVNLKNETSPTVQSDLVLYSAPGGGQNVLWAKNSGQDLPLFTGSALGASRGHSSIYGGIIIQWGTEVQTGLNTTITYPIPFPNAFFTVVATRGQIVTFANFGIGPTATPLVNFVFTCSSSALNNFNWIAIGN